MTDEEKAPTEEGDGLSIIAQLLPGAADDAAEKEEVIPLLTPDGDRPTKPDGTVIDVDVVYRFLDGGTRARYHKVAQQNGRRGDPNYEAAILWLFEKVCKRITGLDNDPLLKGMTPIEYFLKNKNGNTLLNLSMGEYLKRQIGSAADSSKSR